MFIYCSLPVLMLALSFNGQVHAGKIVGGTEVKPHSRPYMVLLEYLQEDNIKSHCGGFLVREDFVLTAAHCQAKSYQVFLGLHDYFDKDKMNVSVKQAFPHEDYNKHGLANDIMLLKLSSKVNFCEKVKPITLSDQNDRSLPKFCSISGWGQTTTKNKRMSRILMEVNVTLNRECPEKKIYCSEGEKGPGDGDSGGPLVCEFGIAYGVMSARTNHTLDSRQYRYTKIPDYRKWIDDIMNQN